MISISFVLEERVTQAAGESAFTEAMQRNVAIKEFTISSHGFPGMH